MNHNPYNPIHSEEYLQNTLRRKFRKKTYSPYHWWRSYKPKRKPLRAGCTTLQKIENGDFDKGPYGYEIQLVEHKLKRSWDKYYPDMVRFLEENSVNLARLKRLKEDNEKDEQSKLDDLYRRFGREFGWDREMCMDKLIEAKGRTLVDVYMNFKK